MFPEVSMKHYRMHFKRVLQDGSVHVMVSLAQVFILKHEIFKSPLVYERSGGLS